MAKIFALPPQAGNENKYKMKDLGYPRTPCPLVFELTVCNRVFRVPAQVVCDARDEHYRDDEEDTFADGEDYDIRDWAVSNMNWDDVAAWAYEIDCDPAQPDSDDFQNAWLGNDGELDLIDVGEGI